MRLEGTAPFGPPAFILVAQADEATLLLPRDERVLTGAAAPAILDALTGIALGPDDLQAVLTGCITPGAQPSGGRSYAGDWLVVDLDDGSVAYLKGPTASPFVVAATTGRWTIEYGDSSSGFPRRVRLMSRPGSVRRTDIQVSIAQFETNMNLDAATFTVKIPPDALPLTLEDLRAAGPLGQKAR
ncbi:MAG: hypothetical protein HYX76_08775 [Acidobacteria bacterium]|nr:hypothetical protein [Acidobacteriota bacterium]